MKRSSRCYCQKAQFSFLLLGRALKNDEVGGGIVVATFIMPSARVAPAAHNGLLLVAARLRRCRRSTRRVCFRATRSNDTTHKLTRALRTRAMEIGSHRMAAARLLAPNTNNVSETHTPHRR
jgi:hypothetical protein